MSHRLQILIPGPLDSRIRQAASRRRLSKGEWVRRAIQRALEEGSGTADPVARLASLGAPTGHIGKMLAEIESGRR